jgi:hypothetical protein
MYPREVIEGSRMTPTARLLLYRTVLWSLLTGVCVYFQGEVMDLFSIMFVVVWMALFVYGLMIVVRAARLLWTEPRKAVPVVCLALPLLVALLLATVGTTPLLKARARAKIPRYEALVTQIRERPLDGMQKVSGHPCFVSPGPPLRVAFVQPGRITDNFFAVVYDPTGYVMMGKRRTGEEVWGDQYFLHAGSLFGEPISKAEHLGGPWYWCRFT